MKGVATGIENLIVLEPEINGDARGYFFEPYNQKKFRDLGLDYQFVQDNESLSRFGTLRGLHCQTGVHAQAKLVRVVHGVVWDVAVDMRPGSQTFKKWFGVELSAENKKMLMVPRGFLHGFAVLSDHAVFSYKVDNFYSPQAELGVLWSDPDLGIDWKVPSKDVLLSDKDKKLQTLAALKDQGHRW